MKELIYLDGNLVPRDEAKVSVFDHGFLYGDGVFEGIRVYNGRVFKLTEHLVRLYESAKSIMLEVYLNIEELEKAVLKTVAANDLRDAYIRIVVSRGVGDLGLDPNKCPKSTIVIIASKISIFPKEHYEKGLKVVTVATRRNIPDALDPKVKSLNYLNNILVKIEANRAGVLEAIMSNSSGYITEGSGDNIFIVRRGKIITPPTYVGALEGITRECVMELAEEMGYTVLERPFTRHDLYIASECFLTGTAAEVIPVIDVDGRIIGEGRPGEITCKIMKAFHKYVMSNGTAVY